MDFIIVENNKVTHIIEVKMSDVTLSKTLKYFHVRFNEAHAIQLVHNAKYKKEVEGCQIHPAGEWLGNLEV